MNRHKYENNSLLLGLFLFVFWGLLCDSSVKAQQKPVVPFKSFAEHSQNINDVEFSPDGKILAIGSSDEKNIVLLNIETGTRLSTLQGFSGYAFAFSPNGRLIAGAGEGGLMIWDVKSGQVLNLQNIPMARGTKRVAFSPNGEFLVSTGWDWYNSIILWDSQGQRLLKVIDVQEAKGRLPKNILFGPDGVTLAIYADNIIELWNVNTQKIVRVLKGDSHDFSDVAFSPDGTILAAGSADDTITLWNLNTGELIRKLTGHVYGVWSIAFRPDGKILVSADNANTIRFWDVQNGEVVYSLPVQGSSTASRLCFSPDGQRLAYMAGLRNYVEVWDVSGIQKTVGATAVTTKFLNPHARKNMTPDEFGRDLFAILKNKDLEGIKKYLWHDQDWVIIAELGHPATKEQIDEYKEKAVPKINAGVTKYHDRYFNIGGIYYDAPTEPIRQLGTLTSVEYVGFIPGIARYSSPRFTNYNDSQLVIRINGSIEMKLEIDHIQLIDGVWHISEIH